PPSMPSAYQPKSVHSLTTAPRRGLSTLLLLAYRRNEARWRENPNSFVFAEREEVLIAGHDILCPCLEGGCYHLVIGRISRDADISTAGRDHRLRLEQAKDGNPVFAANGVAIRDSRVRQPVGHFLKNAPAKSRAGKRRPATR